MTRTDPVPSAAAPAPRPDPVGGRYAGLDGLRAIAVALVVAYHLFPAWWLPQGFIGVDVFFVISGFLITSLLLREAEVSVEEGRGSRISLLDFWRRRARRLLPALITLIVVCGLWAWSVGGDVLVGFGRQVLGALTFTFNWMSISAGSGYFDSGTPELFRNLWSLAVEEQFYVLWPLLFPLLLLIPSRLIRAGVAAVAAAGSALWMAVLVSGAVASGAAASGAAADVTRAYFGTDSHGFGILLGVALAFAVGRALREPTAWMVRPNVRRGVTAVGVLAVAAIIAVATVPPAPDAATFPGALLGACLLTVAAITAGAWPGSMLGRSLDLAPLRWVGVRSYGIYLWHWPVLVLLMAGTAIAPGSEPTLAVGFWALAITLVAATVSYRFIETPVRRHGFRASFAALRARLSGAPAGRFVALGAVTAFVLAAGATTSAIAIAPQTTSGAAAVQAGQQALDEASVSPSPTPTAIEVSPPLAVQTGDEPVPGPRPTTVPGDQVSAIGDSVMLASAPGLMERLPGIQIDASVSRSMNVGVGIAEAQAASGQLRPYVVVALGTNGPISAEALARLEQAIGPDRHLVLVNAFAPRDWIAGVNAELAAFDAAQPGVVVADWAGTAAAHEDLLAGDRIHPGPTGGRLFAETVAGAVQGVENARAQAAFDRSVRVSALASRLVDGDG